MRVFLCSDFLYLIKIAEFLSDGTRTPRYADSCTLYRYGMTDVGCFFLFFYSGRSLSYSYYGYFFIKRDIFIRDEYFLPRKQVLRSLQRACVTSPL